MPAGCQFTFSYSASIRRLPTWEEAESCNGNMMLLSASFSSFYPLRMPHPYLLMSGSLAWGLISALCRLLHDMKHSARTTTTSQRKLLPLRPTRDERSAHDFEKSSAVSSWVITAVANLREQRGEDFFQSKLEPLRIFSQETLFWLFQYKIRMKYCTKNGERARISHGGPRLVVKQLSTGQKLTFPGIHLCVKYHGEGLWFVVFSK